MDANGRLQTASHGRGTDDSSRRLLRTTSAGVQRPWATRIIQDTGALGTVSVPWRRQNCGVARETVTHASTSANSPPLVTRANIVVRLVSGKFHSAVRCYRLLRASRPRTPAVYRPWAQLRRSTEPGQNPTHRTLRDALLSNRQAAGHCSLRSRKLTPTVGSSWPT